MRREALAFALLAAELTGCSPRDAWIEVDPPDAKVSLDGEKVEGKNGRFRLPLSGRDPRGECRLILSKQRLDLHRDPPRDLRVAVAIKSTVV